MDWLSDSQYLFLSLFYVFIYIAAIPIIRLEKDSYICITAAIATQSFGLSPMYNEMLISNPHHILTIYAIIYSVTITHLKAYKVMIACSAMVVAEIVMLGAYSDELFNKVASDYVYSHYELAISCCHVAIIISLVLWSRVGFIAGRIRDSLLRCFSNDGVLLHSRGKTRYNRKSELNKEDIQCLQK